MDPLKLENQICFPLYACAKEIVRLYTPFLRKLNLTYTQYIAMMVLWEEDNTNVKALGEKLYLDTGTLTPLLKKLEKEGYVSRRRSVYDERHLQIALTEKGRALKEKAQSVPAAMQACVNIPPEEAAELHRLLNKTLARLK